ncbi:MAG: hypothetical protein RR971_02330, partial [Alistipes sp.]
MAQQERVSEIKEIVIALALVGGLVILCLCLTGFLPKWIIEILIIGCWLSSIYILFRNLYPKLTPPQQIGFLVCAYAIPGLIIAPLVQGFIADKGATQWEK